MNIDNNYSKDGDIDLKTIFSALFEKKILISSLTTIAIAISIIYSLSIPNIYSSSALLAPSNSDDSFSSNLSSFSSIAGLAGVSLPNRTNTSREAIERIKSFKFFSEQFLSEINLENLIAIDEWSVDDNIITYNEDLFDAKSGKWIRKTNNRKKAMPSDQEAFKVYKRILSISEDKQSTFVNIKIEHQSPHIAKKWTDIIILKINESMRVEDQRIAKNSIDFLNELLLSSSYNNIKEVIIQLLESQMQNLMLASVSESYIYKVIDFPIVAEEKSSPNRFFIVIVGSLLGAMLSILIAMLSHFRKHL